MSKSIAKKALAIAMKREAEKLKKVEGEIIAFMQCELDRYLDELKVWPYTSSECRIMYELSKFPGDKEYEPIMLARITANLGFEVQLKFNREVISISIPMWEKGQKKTTAQLMLYHHQQSVNKALKEKKELKEEMAKQDCQVVLEKIAQEDFQSYKDITEIYRIQVEVEFERIAENDDDYWRKVRSIMDKREFAIVNTTDTTWTLGFHPSAYSNR